MVADAEAVADIVALPGVLGRQQLAARELGIVALLDHGGEFQALGIAGRDQRTVQVGAVIHALRVGDDPALQRSFPGRGKLAAVADRLDEAADGFLGGADRRDAAVQAQGFQLSAHGIGQWRVHGVGPGGRQLHAVQSGADAHAVHAAVLGQPGEGAVAVDVHPGGLLQQLRHVRGHADGVRHIHRALVVGGGYHQFLDRVRRCGQCRQCCQGRDVCCRTSHVASGRLRTRL